MTRHVLIPIDGSEPARAAIDYAFENHATDDLTVLNIVDPGELTPYAGVEGGAMIDFAELHEQRKRDAEALFETVREKAADVGVEISTELVTGRVGHTIVEYATEHGVDHIVIGSHGRSGVDRLLLGSVAETVARRSPVPVTIVR